jgi:hypothetical protein
MKLFFLKSNKKTAEEVDEKCLPKEDGEEGG